MLGLSLGVCLVLIGEFQFFFGCVVNFIVLLLMLQSLSKNAIKFFKIFVKILRILGKSRICSALTLSLKMATCLM